MTYWHGTMHDDVSLIMSESWVNAAMPRKAIEDKERKLSETQDLTIGSGRSSIKYKMDLISPALIVARYFADEQSEVDQLTAACEEASRDVEEYTEEHAVDDGLLAGAMDGDNLSKKLAVDRLKIARREGSDLDEVRALGQVVNLYNAEAEAKKTVKDAQADLDLATFKKYSDLNEPDVKALVLDDKWHATVTSHVAREANGLTQNLVARIQQLGQRYAETVSDIDTALEEIESKVADHLAAMGIEL